MRRLTVVIVAGGLAALAAAGLAGAASLKLKPLSYYGQANKVSFQISETGKQILPFQGYCTAHGINSPLIVNTDTPISINSKGKFKYAGSNALNTPSGETEESKARVTIEGEFVSKTEAVGEYQIHEAGCKPIKFKAKYEAE